MLNSPKQARFGLPDNLGIYVCGSDGFKRFPFSPLIQILHLNWDCLYLYTRHQSLVKVFLKDLRFYKMFFGQILRQHVMQCIREVLI